MTESSRPELLSRNLDRVTVAAALAAILASSLAVQLLGGVVGRVTLGVLVTAVLLIVGVRLRRRPGRRACADVLLALGALSVFGWFSAVVTSIPAVETWIAAAPVAAAFLVVNATKLSSVVVLVAIMVAYRWSPRRLLLVRGRLDAPTGLPRLGWAVAGPVTMVVVVALFLTDPAVLGRVGSVRLAEVLLPVLPLLVAGPVVNAICEELLYRHALIGTMRTVVGVRVALVVSSAIFGLAHVTGSPGGWTGVLFTAAFGLVCGLAMVQNRGTAWNTTIHVVADLAAVVAITIASSGI